MHAKLGTGIALASMTALLLVGCTPDAPVETLPPPPTPPTSEPDPPLSDAQLLAQSFGSAQDLVALVDEGFATGELPLDRMRSLASDEAITEVQVDLDAFNEAGLRIDGTSVLDTPELASRVNSTPNSGSALLLTCLDTSGITTTNGEGQSVSGDVTRQPRVFSFDFEPDGVLITDIGPPTAGSELQGCVS